LNAHVIVNLAYNLPYNNNNKKISKVFTPTWLLGPANYVREIISELVVLGIPMIIYHDTHYYD
jgi:hypothetical protein